jgi:hypothetical protein
MFKTAEQTAEQSADRLPIRFANDNLQEKDAESQRPLRLKGPSKLMVQFAGQPTEKVIKCEKPDQIQMLLAKEKSLRTAEYELAGEFDLLLQEAMYSAEEALKVSLESERRFMFSESLKGDIFEDQPASEMCSQTMNGKNGDTFEEDEHVDDDELRETMSCILKKHRRQNSQACVPNNGLSFTFRCPACVFCFAC